MYYTGEATISCCAQHHGFVLVQRLCRHSCWTRVNQAKLQKGTRAAHQTPKRMLSSACRSVQFIGTCCARMQPVLRVFAETNALFTVWVCPPKRCGLAQALLKERSISAPEGSAAETGSMSSTSAADDLVPISAWLGERFGDAGSSPDGQLAPTEVHTASNDAASSAEPSQSPPPVRGSISSTFTDDGDLNAQPEPSASSITAEQPPEEQPQADARAPQETGWEHQEELRGGVQGYSDGVQESAGTGSSARSAAVGDSYGARNGSSASAATNAGEQPTCGAAG